MSKKSADALRAEYVEILSKLLAERDEDVQRTKSNEIAIPVVDNEGMEQWIIFTVKVPTGSRDGDIYDGYSEAEEYAMKMAEKTEKAKEAAAKKAAKIARDEKARAEKAAAKAAHEAKINGEG